ncbi:MAG: hypothetical protein EP338_02315 [Bacteroidetes bacterium]|nr:MAG: hypothetical protein EP338_02315 [Bacteroidota bacterium]
MNDPRHLSDNDFSIPIQDVKISVKSFESPVLPPLDEETSLNETHFLLRVPQVANYLVKEGREIFIEPAEGAEQDLIRLYLNGSVLGALLIQRNILCFHASAFEYHQQAVLICGESESGKSSLALAMHLNGMKLINDDICPINHPDFNVLPLETPSKLWADSLQELQQEKLKGPAIHSGENKFFVDIKHKQHENLPVRGIIILENDAVNDFEIEALQGMEKFTALRSHLYRGNYLAQMPKTESLFHQRLSLLASRIPVFRFNRPYSANIETSQARLLSVLEKYYL